LYDFARSHEVCPSTLSRLVCIGNGQDIAVSVFLSSKDFYHPIAAKMIASDLMIDKKKDLGLSSFLPKPTMGVLAGVAAIAAVAVGFVLLRR
jgi:hypothetical protein